MIPSRNLFPHFRITLLLGVIFLVGNIAQGLYSALHIQESSGFLILFSFSISSCLALWVLYDSRARESSMGLSQAIYIYFAWPLSFPYYLFMTRGFRSGGKLILSFFGLYILTFILSIPVFVAVSVIRVIMLNGH